MPQHSCRVPGSVRGGLPRTGTWTVTTFFPLLPPFPSVLIFWACEQGAPALELHRQTRRWPPVPVACWSSAHCS